MGGILQVDTIKNNNASTIITQTNTTTLTFGSSGQTIVIPSGTTFNASSASVNLPSINLATGVTGTLPIANGGTGTTSTTFANLATNVTGTLPATNGGTGNASFTTGDLLYASNATTLTKLAVGTSTQVLGVSSGAPAWTTVSSDYVLLATTTASSSAAVSFDGYYSSTYKNYKVIISNAIPSTDSVFFYVRFRRSNADVTASNYSHILGAFYIQNDGGVGAPGIDYLGLWATSYIRTNYEYLSNTTSTGGINLNVDIYDPLNASSYKSIYINGVSQNANSTKVMSYANSGLLRDSTAALSGITFYMSSGNIASGTFKLYGIK